MAEAVWMGSINCQTVSILIKSGDGDEETGIFSFETSVPQNSSFCSTHAAPSFVSILTESLQHSSTPHKTSENHVVAALCGKFSNKKITVAEKKKFFCDVANLWRKLIFRVRKDGISDKRPFCSLFHRNILCELAVCMYFLCVGDNVGEGRDWILAPNFFVGELGAMKTWPQNYPWNCFQLINEQRCNSKSTWLTFQTLKSLLFPFHNSIVYLHDVPAKYSQKKL